LFWFSGNLQNRTTAYASNIIQSRVVWPGLSKIGNRSKVIFDLKSQQCIHRASLAASYNQLQSGASQLHYLRSAGRLTSGSSRSLRSLGRRAAAP
jgi:hypothetical protein